MSRIHAAQMFRPRFQKPQEELGDQAAVVKIVPLGTVVALLVAPGAVPAENGMQPVVPDDPTDLVRQNVGDRKVAFETELLRRVVDPDRPLLVFLLRLSR